MKHILSIGLIVLFVTPCFSGMIPADNVQTNGGSGSVNQHVFTDCYVETAGTLHNDWFSFSKLFIHHFQFGIKNKGENEYTFLFGHTLYDKEDAVVKIFNEKDGEILWEYDQSKDVLVIFIGYDGEYDFVKIEEYLPTISYNGYCQGVITLVRNFPWYKFV
jgi:hypothetical protein